ncbi:MAG: hypothetical protein R3C11_05760 [Planctomycetaceae bacterium]
MAVIIFGLLVAILGAGLVISHVRVWKKQSSQPNIEKSELRSQHWQYRRRLATSGLMVLVGLLIMLGQAVDKIAHPAVFTVIWILVILITLSLMCLALLDMMIVRQGLKTKLVILEAKKRQLEIEAKILKQKQEGNHELN